MQNKSELSKKINEDMLQKWNGNVTWLKSIYGETGFNDMILSELKPELEEKPFDLVSAKIMFEMIKKASGKTNVR